MKRLASFALPAMASLVVLWQPAAQAQNNTNPNPECLGSQCGSPQSVGGGGCSCSCGCSVWVAYTDDGKQLSYTDDSDGDGIPDDKDNCPFVANRDQKDTDGDGVGDACDNCPTIANKDQKRSFCPDPARAKLGNACRFIIDPNNACVGAWDPDCDNKGSGRADGKCYDDNCTLVYNPDQVQTDPKAPLDPVTKKLEGDACNALYCKDVPSNCNGKDSDGDGIDDKHDNCVLAYNPDQLDTDGDGIGDACDADLDGDSVENDDGTSPRDPTNNKRCLGSNGCNQNGPDNCPRTPNDQQTNTNGVANANSAYGFGDVCYSGWPAYNVGQEGPHRVRVNGVLIDPRNAIMFTMGGKYTGLDTGKQYNIDVYGNRNGAALTAKFAILSGEGEVLNPVATYSTSSNNLYNPPANPPQVKITGSGAVQVQMNWTLAFADRSSPGIMNGSDVATFEPSSASSGGGHTGCSAVPGGLSAVGVGLALLGILRRRRR